MLRRSLLSLLKPIIGKPGFREHEIRFGLLRALRFRLDLADASQLYVGLAEREIAASVKQLSRNIATGLDVGAAQGTYSIYFLKRTAARAVFAFEPTEAAAELRRNLELNHLGGDARFTLVPEFVGDGAGGRTRALDSLLPSIASPCLAKIDVEGHEAHVLRGAPRLLAMPDVRWIIETHSKSVEDECIAILKAAGYRTKVIKPAWWRRVIPETRVIAHNRWLVATR